MSASSSDSIGVRGLRLWAHVGVLDVERTDGQWFELAFTLWGDLRDAARNDDLAASLDYSPALSALQRQARTIRCLTIEHYSEQILDLLEGLYGPIPMEIRLTKCRPPIAGFSGDVTLVRRRHTPP